MNGIIEKVVVPGAIFLAWVASFEWRLRSKVGKDRFDDMIARLDRIEKKVDNRNEKENKDV